MSTCGSCKQPISPKKNFATCRNCKADLHLANGCSGLRETTWMAKSKSAMSAWVCPTCRNLPKEDETNEIGDHREGSDVLWLSKIEELLDRKFKEVGMVELTAKVTSLQQENTVLRNRVDELDEKVMELESRIEYKIEEQNQYSRRNNMIVDGLSEITGELPIDTALRFASKVGYQLTREQIDDCHRLPKKKNALTQAPRPFIIRFVNRHVKRNMLIKLKNSKPSGIFVNDHLTFYSTQIKMEARRLLKPLGYIVESRDCTIFVRKGEVKHKLLSTQQVVELAQKIGPNLNSQNLDNGVHQHQQSTS